MHPWAEEFCGVTSGCGFNKDTHSLGLGPRGHGRQATGFSTDSNDSFPSLF